MTTCPGLGLGPRGLFRSSTGAGSRRRHFTFN